MSKTIKSSHVPVHHDLMTILTNCGFYVDINVVEFAEW